MSRKLIPFLILNKTPRKHVIFTEKKRKKIKKIKQDRSLMIRKSREVDKIIIYKPEVFRKRKLVTEKVAHFWTLNFKLFFSSWSLGSFH
ncbi:hypothetical protein PUN28_015332 [Cardiocondyla obscurior]|uniref:Uncharacterized protein n=1 Tax=Cardiocondyla obscurior TaxID=286306 RepID=A0AAW2EWU8_9HYME